jgi:hypothetical protein
MKFLENTMDQFAQPVSSGVSQKITAELQIPDPEKSIAMELLNESRSNKGANGDHREGGRPNSP